MTLEKMSHVFLDLYDADIDPYDFFDVMTGERYDTNVTDKALARMLDCSLKFEEKEHTRELQNAVAHWLFEDLKKRVR